MPVSNSTNNKKGKILTTAELTERKSWPTPLKRLKGKQYQQDYKKYVSNPAKYEEFKRQDCERKAAMKASEFAAYAKETLSSPPSCSFKHYATKVRSLKKVESALPNSCEKSINCDKFGH